MNRLCASTGAVLLLSGLFAAEGANAQYFRTSLTLTTGRNELQQTFIHSYANAELFDANGNRIYNVECILGHSVTNLTVSEDVFRAQIVNSHGYLNSTTDDFLAGANQCFGATMIAHSNSYNLHPRQDTEPVCTGPAGASTQKPEKYTPVLLDLDTDGFHLSGPDPAVSFDLNGDGRPERTAWTSIGEDDAFLCMDRNENGVIDDGKELFGSATPLLSGGTAESGYAALGEFDWPQAGGNGDGKVDANDPLFERLCVWVDANRDGDSQRKEISGLEQARVTGFEARYKKLHKEDDFGNLFRYTSRVYMRSPVGVVTAWPSFDVIFAVP